MKENWVPVSCVAAALVTYLLNGYFIEAFQFDFGFMNIFVNAFLTVLFLIFIKKRANDARQGFEHHSNG